MSTRLFWVVAVAGLVAACNGAIGDVPSVEGGGVPGDEPPPSGTGTDWIDSDVPTEEVCASVGTDVGPTPLRRLSRIEYNNTVHDLLGDTTSPADAFPPDEDIGAFASGAPVSPILAERYLEAAEALATTAVADMPGLLPCSPGTTASSQNACARQFFEAFGKRAYRRPVESAEVDALFGLFDATRSMDGFADGIRVALTAMLQSPYFLYRPDLGVSIGPGVVSLTDYEVASRLSYYLWNTMPDDELFAAADAGQLTTADGIATQARRLLADPRAHGSVHNFFSQWLRLSELEVLTKDPAFFPEYNETVAQAMIGESNRFIDYVLWDSDARLKTLLTAPVAFVNAALAPIYGVRGISGSTLTRVDLDPAQRAGIITQASLLTMHAQAYETSPVLRGKWVRERVLCQPMPDPPADLMVVPPEPDPTATTRERYSQHSTDPSCYACHQMMDPIGFGFEAYDGIGRYRTEDDGMPIDVSGEIFSSVDVDGPFNGAVELAHRLADSRQVAACTAHQWFIYALGRGLTDEDECSARRLLDAFQMADGNILELIVGITATDAFRHRQGLVAP